MKRSSDILAGPSSNRRRRSYLPVTVKHALRSSDVAPRPASRSPAPRTSLTRRTMTSNGTPAANVLCRNSKSIDPLPFACVVNDISGPVGSGMRKLGNRKFTGGSLGDHGGTPLALWQTPSALFTRSDSPARWTMYVVALEGHNGLLIGGKGQQPKTKGTLTKLAGAKSWDGVVGDASLNYGGGVTKAKRHFIVVRRSCVVVVDEVVLFADRDERGISRPEPAAVSIGLESRFTGQDDVDLVGCVSHRGIRRRGNADEHAYLEVR